MGEKGWADFHSAQLILNNLGIRRADPSPPAATPAVRTVQPRSYHVDGQGPSTWGRASQSQPRLGQARAKEDSTLNPNTCSELSAATLLDVHEQQLAEDSVLGFLLLPLAPSYSQTNHFPSHPVTRQSPHPHVKLRPSLTSILHQFSICQPSPQHVLHSDTKSFPWKCPFDHYFDVISMCSFPTASPFKFKIIHHYCVFYKLLTFSDIIFWHTPISIPPVK